MAFQRITQRGETKNRTLRRLQILLVTIMAATAIGPEGVGVAAKLADASASTPPYQQAYAQHDCWVTGTGTCNSDAISKSRLCH